MRWFGQKTKRRLDVTDDWYSLTAAEISNNGGDGLLALYNDSLYEILRATLPDVGWEKTKFR